MLIAGNGKLYKGPAETAEFCVELRRRLADLEGVDVAVCPPFISLAVAVQVLAGTEIAVAAQNPRGSSQRNIGRLRDILQARNMRRSHDHPASFSDKRTGCWQAFASIAP